MADQLWVRTTQRPLASPARPVAGEPRWALCTVNFSTTRYLKLLLLTLSEQHRLDLLSRIVIADNASRDGGPTFLRVLEGRVPRLHLVENRHFLNHARGMRGALRKLAEVEQDIRVQARCNLLLFCDTDVVFRNPQTLYDLAAVMAVHDAAFAGELRQLYEYPDCQASFFAVRREVYERRDVKPWVNHGAPAYWMQRSIWKADLPVVNFPSNQGGYVLHRGRAGTEAAQHFRPHSSRAGANAQPMYMGIAGWRADLGGDRCAARAAARARGRVRAHRTPRRALRQTRRQLTSVSSTWFHSAATTARSNSPRQR